MAGLWAKVLGAVKSTTLEPVMVIDGAASNAMIILMENVQMYKTCTNTLGFSDDICNNLSNHTEENILVQKELSMFTFYNSIILSVVALLFILFMGAWSDVYGRKFPLLLVFLCQAVNAAGYLLVLIVPSLPAELIYGASFIMSLGGGNPGLMSLAFSYASDISSEENRTVKISTLNSLWYLGGPIGTALTGLVLKHSTYHMALSIMLGLNTFAFFYIIFIIKESCGPFAKIGNCLKDSEKQSLKKEDVSFGRMVADFINWKRVVESFHTLLKPRPGYNRALLLTSVVSNMARRAARSFFLYLFVRLVLGWDASIYSYWTTCRILITAVSSLFLVPLLSKLLNASDYTLVAWGSVSSALEFASYALVFSPSLVSIIWVSPVMGLLTNAQIALRSFPTKIVDPDEKGRVSAATGALTSLMPMAGYACYTLIYRETVESYPGAQFIFGAGINFVIAIVFLALYAATKSGSLADVEKNEPTKQRRMSNSIFAASELSSATGGVLPKKAGDVTRTVSLGGCYGNIQPVPCCRTAGALNAPRKSQSEKRHSPKCESQTKLALRKVAASGEHDKRCQVASRYVSHKECSSDSCHVGANDLYAKKTFMEEVECHSMDGSDNGVESHSTDVCESGTECQSIYSSETLADEQSLPSVSRAESHQSLTAQIQGTWDACDNEAASHTHTGRSQKVGRSDASSPRGGDSKQGKEIDDSSRPCQRYSNPISDDEIMSSERL